MGKVVHFIPAADPVAQSLWVAVAEHSDAVSHLVVGIAYASVSGPESRADLAAAEELLARARALLRRTEERTARQYAVHPACWSP